MELTKNLALAAAVFVAGFFGIQILLTGIETMFGEGPATFVAGGITGVALFYAIGARL